MARALIALGSNLGERLQTLEAAAAAIGGFPQTSLVARSSFYETSPIGGPLGQDAFVNGAIVVETSLEPIPLLDRLLELETALGRVRDVPWGPRPIDLDILLYDDAEIDEPRLRVPHPRLAFRKFVLRGAVEIAGDWRHPLLGRTLQDLATHLETTPRYAALVGMPHGFRSQFAAEAADAARARLVDATDAGVPASVDELDSHGLTASRAIEFLRARAVAVRRSLAEADGAWVVDDAWLAAEAVELASRLATAERDRFLAEVPSVLTDDVTPRLLVAPTSTGAAPHAAPLAFVGSSPFEIALPPIVDAAIADRETALMEIAAALEASA